MNETSRLDGRMIRRHLFASGIVLVLFVTTSCTPNSAPVDPIDTVALAQALTQLDDDWSRAAATRDAAAVGAFYAADAVAYPPNEPVAVGQAAAQEVWAAYFADSTFTISWTTNHAEVAKSGELGFTAGTYEDSYRGPDGAMVLEKGKYLCVWARQADGSWKAVHDMWNTDSK